MVNNRSAEDFDREGMEHAQQLLTLLIEMVNAQGGTPIPTGASWMADRQTLAKKFIYHMHTAHQLLNGSTLVSRALVHEFVPYASIFVVVRAALETFVTFGYIFANVDDEVSRFRHLTWKASGLNDRQGARARTASEAAKLAEEGVEIERLLAEIKGHPQFKTFAADGQGKLTKKRDWRAGVGWPTLASGIGIHKKFFAEQYDFACSYSHASYLAVMQLSQADKNRERAMALSMLLTANAFIAHFVHLYSGIFPSAKSILEVSPSRRAYGFWMRPKDQYTKIYGPED